MLINISELLDDPLFTEPHEVGITTRTTVNGKPVESVEWVTINANTQPLGDEALQRLPEAERFKAQYQFFTNVRSVKVGDYLRMNGKKYRAVTDQDFDKYGYADNIFILYDGVEDVNNGGFELPYNDQKYFGFNDGGDDNYGFGVGSFIDA